MSFSLKTIDTCREVLQKCIADLKHQDYISPECETIKYDLLKRFQEALNEVEAFYQNYKKKGC